MIELQGRYSKAQIFIDEVEDGVIPQVYSILNSPISENSKVKIMPDCHVGKGCVIGTTMELTDKLNVEIVGVDISCGMLSGMFKPKSKLDFTDIDEKIRKRIPMGFNTHGSVIFKDIPFDLVQRDADEFTIKYNSKFGTNFVSPIYDERWLTNKLVQIGMDAKVFYRSIGTLGGSNHFWELGKTDSSQYWITVHSGSRNFGLKIAEYWGNVARKDMARPDKDYILKLENIKRNTLDKTQIPILINELKKSVGLDNRTDMAYLTGEDLVGYLYDSIFVNRYSESNRQVMMNISAEILRVDHFEDMVSSVHNYINFNDFIIRKGSIASYEGKKMIIPFNMRDGILLCEGKSNSDWNFSAPHGAGRLMSRGQAKKSVRMDDFKESMKGIFSTSVVESTLDESPMAYKDSAMIEAAIKPTATILERIRPILNIKDKGESVSWKEKKDRIKKLKAERADGRMRKTSERDF